MHNGSNEGLIRRGVGHLSENRVDWPRFFDDGSLINGFVKRGCTKELTCRRFADECHWMSIPGIEYTLSDLAEVNTAKVPEIAYYDMMKHEEELSTVLLWGYFKRYLGKAVAVTAEDILFHLKYQKRNRPEPIYNLFSHGPVEGGRDITESVRYFDMYIDGAGLATMTDNFAVHEQRIERGNKISFEDLTHHI